LSQAKGNVGVEPGSPQPANDGKGKDPAAPIDIDDDDNTDVVEDPESGEEDEGNPIMMELSDGDS
jgi:hypothetical protein